MDNSTDAQLNNPDNLSIDQKLDLLLKSSSILNQEIRKLKTDQQEMYELASSTAKTDENMAKNFKKIINEFRKLEHETSRTNKNIKYVEEQVDFIKQKQLNKTIRISGIPYIEGEDVKLICVTLFENINCNLTVNDLDNYYRIKRSRGTPTNIVVLEFLRKVDCINFLSLAKSIKQNLNLFHLKFSSVPADVNKRVFINESMTRDNSRLFARAKTFKKTGHIKYVWYKKGMIFARNTENGPHYRITPEILENMEPKVPTEYETDSSEFELNEKNRKKCTYQEEEIHNNSNESKQRTAKQVSIKSADKKRHWHQLSPTMNTHESISKKKIETCTGDVNKDTSYQDTMASSPHS